MGNSNRAGEQGSHFSHPEVLEIVDKVMGSTAGATITIQKQPLISGRARVRIEVFRDEEIRMTVEALQHTHVLHPQQLTGERNDRPRS